MREGMREFLEIWGNFFRGLGKGVFGLFAPLVVGLAIAALFLILYLGVEALIRGWGE
jgi:hypothetical protein